MIRRELIVFLGVGILTVLVDFTTYRVLLSVIDLKTAKCIGFITGTLFAYLANKTWTFGHRQVIKGSLSRFILLYTITLLTNVIVNSNVLLLLNKNHWAIQVAFLIATAISASLNFIGMKWFVFKENQA